MMETIFDCFFNRLNSPKYHTHTHTNTQTLIQLTEIEKLLFSVDQMMKTIDIACRVTKHPNVKEAQVGRKKSQLLFIYYLFSNTEGSEGRDRERT